MIHTAQNTLYAKYTIWIHTEHTIHRMHKINRIVHNKRQNTLYTKCLGYISGTLNHWVYIWGGFGFGPSRSIQN